MAHRDPQIWSSDESDCDGSETSGTSALVSADGPGGSEGGGAPSDTPEAEERRFWAHARYLYTYMLQLRPVVGGGGPALAWLPPVKPGAKGVLEVQFVIASGEVQLPVRQHYVTTMKARLPPCCNLPESAQLMVRQDGGVNVQGPKMSTDVVSRQYHDGSVSALCLWPPNPSVFITCSPGRSDVHLYHTIRQEWARTEPRRADPRVLARAGGDKRTKKLREAEQRTQRVHDAWLGHTADAPPRPDALLRGLPAPPTAAAFSATPAGWAAAGCADGDVCLWRACVQKKNMPVLPAAVRPVRVLPPDADGLSPAGDSPVGFLEFSKNYPTTLAGGSADGTLWLFDVTEAAQKPDTYHCVRTDVSPAPLTCGAWSPHCGPGNPEIIAVGDAAGECRVIYFNHSEDAGAAVPLRVLRGHQKGAALRTVAWSPHAPGALVTGGDDGMCCLWFVHGGKGGDEPVFKHAAHHPHRRAILRVAWHPHRELRGVIATVTEGGEISIWRPQNHIWAKMPAAAGEEDKGVDP